MDQAEHPAAGPESGSDLNWVLFASPGPGFAHTLANIAALSALFAWLHVHLLCPGSGGLHLGAVSGPGTHEGGRQGGRNHQQGSWGAGSRSDNCSGLHTSDGETAADGSFCLLHSSKP